MECKDFVKNTTFNSHIENIFHISQYCVNNKLITFYGEYHTLSHNSRRLVYYKPLSDFVAEKLQENKNSKILLEFGPYTSTPDKIGSSNINMIYEKVKELGLNDRIIPFDFRFNCIDINEYFQYILFANPHFEKLPLEVIDEKFLQPFFLKEELFKEKLKSEMYEDPNFLNFLENSYYKSIKGNLQFIYVDMMKRKDPRINSNDLYFKTMEDIRVVILNEWAKVADFFILSAIFEKNDVNEYNILLGDFHRKNLEDVFKKYDKIYSSSNGSINGIYFHKDHYSKKLLEFFSK